MWECFHSCAPYIKDTKGQWHTRPEFPRFPPDCPLSFALLAISCLTPNPLDRPNFWQMVGVLEDLRAYLRGAATRDTAAAHATLVEIESPHPSPQGAAHANEDPQAAAEPHRSAAGDGISTSMRSMREILLRTSTPPDLSSGTGPLAASPVRLLRLTCVVQCRSLS
jgi:hypothetical protein